MCPMAASSSMAEVGRWWSWHWVQTQKQHFLQQWRWLVQWRQKWHSRGEWKCASRRGCLQQQVSRGMGLHSKQQLSPSSLQYMHRSFMLFSRLQPTQQSYQSSDPVMQTRTWFFWHLRVMGRCLSVVTVRQQSTHWGQSLTLHSLSQQYQWCSLPHLMHPNSCSCGPAGSEVIMSCQWAQVLSKLMSMILQLTQQLFWQLQQYLGHSFTFVHKVQAVGLQTPSTNYSGFPHEHWVLILAISSLGLDWSKCQGSQLQQSSQIPKLQRLSSQTPSLLTAVLTPQMSQMKLRLAICWQEKAWPMGHPSLAQGGTRHPTQYSWLQILQQDLHSRFSLQATQLDSSISSQDPTKNSSWWPLRHLYSACMRLKQRSSWETKGQWRQWWSKALRESMAMWHSEGLQGQKKSSCISGSRSTRKGSLHLRGQRSTSWRVSDTHFMQQIFLQGPLHRMGFMHTSQQMPHSYLSRISADLRKLVAVKPFFSMFRQLQMIIKRPKNQDCKINTSSEYPLLPLNSKRIVWAVGKTGGTSENIAFEYLLI